MVTRANVSTLCCRTLKFAIIVFLSVTSVVACKKPDKLLDVDFERVQNGLSIAEIVLKEDEVGDGAVIGIPEIIVWLVSGLG